MKILSTALLAAGLVTLGGCGGGDEKAANNVSADSYNVADDLGTENLVSEDLGNDLVLDNAANTATENVVDVNTAANTQ